MPWHKIIFQLEDFGHHNAQLISKNYLTYPFFTPIQVNYALTYGEDLLSHPNYVEAKPNSTPAVPVEEPRIIQWLYTIRNVFKGKPFYQSVGEKPWDVGSTYPTFGKIQFILPGTKFQTYSQHLPKSHVIMIGKKRRVARVLSVKEVESVEERLKLTSPDLISRQAFEDLSPTEYQILAMSSRWVYGRFKVDRCLRIGEDYFVSPLIGEVSEVNEQ